MQYTVNMENKIEAKLYRFEIYSSLQRYSFTYKCLMKIHSYRPCGYNLGLHWQSRFCREIKKEICEVFSFGSRPK